MRVYVTKSVKLTVAIIVGGEKKTLIFNRGIRAEKLKALMVNDEDTIKALESCSAFGNEFWFFEELPDVQPKILARSTKKIYYKPGTEPKGETTEQPKAPEPPITETLEPVNPPVNPLPKADDKPATDYPEVTNGQKAKLLLLTLVKDSVHADFTPATKAREAAKKLNITFSNWPVQ